MADDLGYGDLGCYGGPDIPTPHIDRLAAEGTRFTRAYAYPVCTPTRAALLTGQYAERHGFPGKSVLMGKDNPRFAPAVTFASRLQDVGYRTALVGKWHLGYTPSVLPRDKGFEEFFGHLGGKVDFYQHTDNAQPNGKPEGRHDLWENETEVHREGYLTELITERSQRFLNTADPRPFFLFVSHGAPHYGRRNLWQAPRAYLEKFNAVGQTSGRGVYAAMVSALDDAVGALLADLKARGLEQNTLVIFMSDNGGDDFSRNLPLRGKKATSWEGGLRVPLIVRLPGRVAAGATRDETISVLDLAPTLLGYAGIAAPDAAFDGRDLWQALRDNQPLPPAPPLFLADAVIDGPWKLQGRALHHLEADLGETRDVSAEHPEILARLAALPRPW
jgi:arylsulfatase A-like enzyme